MLNKVEFKFVIQNYCIKPSWTNWNFKVTNYQLEIVSDQFVIRNLYLEKLFKLCVEIEIMELKYVLK